MPAIAARPTKRPTNGAAQPHFETLQDVLDGLGGVSPERVHLHPWPGAATQRDLLARYGDTEGKLELVDGILVEKPPMGLFQSVMATILAGEIRAYLKHDNIGLVSTGRDSFIKLKRGLIRVPDLVFVRWDRVPERETPEEPCPALIADLVVEVLSPSNRRKEMERKRRDFFDRGTKLFWIVDPRKQTVTVYHGINDGDVLGLDDEVDGEDVLPGFRLSIRTWFELAKTGNTWPRRPKRS
jgi:Uma2 family endonuclease